jgi:surface antigen
MPKKMLTTRFFQALRLMAVATASLGLIGGATLAHADQYDDQINALQSQSNATQGLLNGLESQASSYQAQIGALAAQISAVQGQIAANQAQQATLEAEIQSDQQQITTKKTSLSADVKAMYIDGSMSTIEELATSNDLSAYVDKEEYRSSVQNALNSTIQQIAALQADQQKQKGELDTAIASEQSQNAQLASVQAQQQQLLAYNQGQQDAFNSQISANSGQIAKLRQEQIVANTRYNIGSFHGSPGNGGYPDIWANAPQDSMVDDWGMYNRECVSYTAYRVHQDYVAGKDSHDMPYWGGAGNANQWPGDAERAGIPVDSNPTPGSIAISTAGAFGHAMYVESINGNEIYVQQFNQQLTGQYSEGWRYTTGLVFLHF